MFIDIAAEANIPKSGIAIKPRDSPWYINDLLFMKRKLNRLLKKFKANNVSLKGEQAHISPFVFNNTALEKRKLRTRNLPKFLTNVIHVYHHMTKNEHILVAVCN